MPNSDSFEHFLGEEVVDSTGQPIGTFACYWEREPGKPLLLGIDTPDASTKTHVVPAKGAQLNERHSCVQLSFDKDKVEHAPCLECGDDLNSEMKQQVCLYYGVNLFVGGAKEADMDGQLRRINRPGPR